MSRIKKIVSRTTKHGTLQKLQGMGLFTTYKNYNGNRKHLQHGLLQVSQGMGCISSRDMKNSNMLRTPMPFEGFREHLWNSTKPFGNITNLLEHSRKFWTTYIKNDVIPKPFGCFL